MTESVARLRGDQLTLGYGSYTVAKNLNVSIPDGHFTAIIGPNGCGKSTLLRTLSRLMTPVDGHVWLDGEQIQRYASKEVARRIGLLAQKRHYAGRYHRTRAGRQRALSASAVIYPLAQGRCRRRRQCHACNRYHLTGDAKRRYSVRRPTSAGVDSHGAGTGNVHHAAG